MGPCGAGGAARESGVAGEEKGLATQVAAPFLSGQLTPDNIHASHAMRRPHGKTSQDLFRNDVPGRKRACNL